MTRHNLKDGKYGVSVEFFLSRKRTNELIDLQLLHRPMKPDVTLISTDLLPAEGRHLPEVEPAETQDLVDVLKHGNLEEE